MADVYSFCSSKYVVHIHSPNIMEVYVVDTPTSVVVDGVTTDGIQLVPFSCRHGFLTKGMVYAIIGLSLVNSSCIENLLSYVEAASA
jgi:hypothetical protein